MEDFRNEGFIDPTLGSNFREESMMKTIRIAHSCIQPMGAPPRVNDLINEMNGALQLEKGQIDEKSTSDCDPKGKRQQPQTSTTQSHGSRSVFQIVPIYHLMQEMTRGLIVNNLCCGTV